MSLVGIARFNADGTLDSGFQEGRFGIVNSIAVQGDGKVILGGAFTIARLWAQR